MAFRFGMPVVQPDARGYREDELASLRPTASVQSRQRRTRPSILDDNQTSLSAIMPRQPLSKTPETPASALPPAPNRRHVVTPDPISLRYVSWSEGGGSFVQNGGRGRQKTD